MKLVNETLNEFQNFDRKGDSKEKLGIGIIPSITSDDLEILSDLYDEESLIPYEKWYADHREDYEDDIEAEETYKRLHHIASALGDRIQWGEFFDHHEEDDLEEYLSFPPPGMKYAYNAYPDADGWDVVWSSIRLPSAEELI